ncbi:serine hydrolase [Vibrio cholerae]
MNVEVPCMNEYSELLESLSNLEHIDGSQIAIKKGTHLITKNYGAFTNDSLVNVYSISKAVSAILLKVALKQNNISESSSIKRYWPELFRLNSQHTISFSDVLEHRAGFPFTDILLCVQDTFDWNYMIQAIENTVAKGLEEQETIYHARTYGFIIGHLIERITGMKIESFFHSQFGKDTNIYYSVPSQVSKDVIHLEDVSRNNGLVPDENSIISDSKKVYTTAVFSNPSTEITSPNCPEWERAILPSSGCFSNAKSIVSFFSNCFEKYEFILKDICACLYDVERQQVDDLALGFPVHWNNGFSLNSEEFGNSSSRFGIRAIGGSIYFFDEKKDLHFCFTTSKMIAQVGLHPAHDPRIIELMRTI